MESKHTFTPGPWRWSDEYADTQGRKTWSLLGAEGYGILSCDGAANSPQGLGDNANATLIAAAPELLAAVDALYQRLPDELARDMGWVESLLDRCGKPYRAEGGN